MPPEDSPRFSLTRLRPGYVREDVDALIERIEATLGFYGAPAAPPVTAEDVRKARFRTTRLKTGYDEEEVDSALDAYVEQLRQLGESRR
jgi:DivIVA domain-containing protein